MNAIANFVTALPGYLVARPAMGALVACGYTVLIGITIWTIVRAR